MGTWSCSDGIVRIFRQQGGLTAGQRERQRKGRKIVEDLISVIVPVYNSAPYIRDCADSVLKQTYRNFELLLIDDGSADDSRRICERLGREDGRIRVLARPHKGVSAARNAGIEEAKGKYLFFMDSDDVIHPRLLEELKRLLERDKTGMAAEGYCEIGDGDFCRTEAKREEGGRPEGIYLSSSQAADYKSFGSPDMKFYAIGGKMIRREAMEGVRFHERLTHGEDTLFMYQLISRGLDAVVLKADWYYYRSHRGEVTDVYTVRTCRCRYAVNRYIRDHEAGYGRYENAVRWENATTASIMKWYTVACDAGDRHLKRYARKLGGRERRTELFSCLTRTRKVEFNMALYCHPVFLIMSPLPCMWLGTEDKWKWVRQWRKVNSRIQKFCTKWKWKIKGRITWLKWAAREEWAKAWRIRNRVKWGCRRLRSAARQGLRRLKWLVREAWDRSWRLKNKVRWGWVLLKNVAGGRHEGSGINNHSGL